jgi:hypothetical protein
MKTDARILNRFLFIIVGSLFILLFALFFYYESQVNQRELDLVRSSSVTELLDAELEARQNIIAELESTLSERGFQINGLEDEIGQLSTQITDLEYEISSRTCQSVGYAEFDRRVRLGTTYVITPAQMDWTSYWSLRTNVLFEENNYLARGYEVRYDLTPATFSDEWQEIHSTIRAYTSHEAAASFFEKKGSGDDKIYLESSLDLGIPIKVWTNGSSDPDNTVTLSLLCGFIQADLKLKLLEDKSQALVYLEEAATMLFHDISVWIP